MSSDRAIVSLLLLTMFTSGADLLVMSPILPAVADDLGVGADYGGLWVTAYAIATGLFALGFGPVSDRFGRRTILRAGMLVLVAGTATCALADGFYSMMASRFLAGAGAGMLVTSTTSYAGDHFEPARRAEAVGWVMSGFFASLILAVPIGALLADAFGWRRMFLVLTGFGSLMAALLFLLPRPRYEERSPRLSIFYASSVYRELLKDLRVGGVLAMSFSVGLAMTMFSVYSSPWMKITFGLDTADRGLVYAAGGPAVFVGGPLAGRLSNHFGRVWLVVVGSALMGTMQLAMPLTAGATAYLAQFSWLDGFPPFGHLPWPMVLPAIVVFFLAMAAGATRSAPFQTLALEVAPPERRGAVSALRNGSNQLGSALGAALGGFLWNRLDPAYEAICVLAAGVTFLGAFALFWLVGLDRPSP